MLTIQSLRRSRGITLTDLALLSGIPVRTIAAIECGLHHLDHRTREQIAHIFAVPPESLQPGAPPALQHALRRRLIAEARLVSPVIGAALATALALAPVLSGLQPHQAPALAIAPAQAIAQALESAPAAAAQPAFGLVASLPSAAASLELWRAAPPSAGTALQDGGLVSSGGSKARLVQVSSAPAPSGVPYGCPLAPDGRVAVTQGYGEGTHAPADVWGALDLGVDRDGDGYAEPESSRGTLVFAPNGGVARVVLDSWPGGNYVRVTDPATGWATAYAHLDQVFVSDGQTLEPGTVIGTVGSTGYSTAPHLHYEVWHGGVNVDPTPYVLCG